MTTRTQEHAMETYLTLSLTNDEIRTHLKARIDFHEERATLNREQATRLTIEAKRAQETLGGQQQHEVAPNTTAMYAESGLQRQAQMHANNATEHEKHAKRFRFFLAHLPQRTLFEFDVGTCRELEFLP